MLTKQVTPRQFWLWSIPTFAAIVSYLWYKKTKRGTFIKKTDKGGVPGEVDNSDNKIITCVDTDSEVSAGAGVSVQVCLIQEEVETVREEIQEIEEVEVAVKSVVLETAPQVEEEEVEEVTVDERNKCKKNKCEEMAKKIDEKSENLIETKLTKLDLSKSVTGSEAQVAENKDMTQGSGSGGDERDSANNSPSEVMLASPSISAYSDTNSEGSSDSGKGCSEVLTPSRTPASGNSVSGDLPVLTVYEFLIPQHLVGRLIGRFGSYIHEVKCATNASLFIKDHPDTSGMKICSVEGTQMDIDSALEMIRKKFPKKRFPQMTMEQILPATGDDVVVSVLPDNMQLYLVEGINNDVILSSLVTAGHFFLQQPTHPTYLSLHRLTTCMALCYCEPNQPTIPDDVSCGVLCAAPALDGWYRAQIIALDRDNDLCDIKFVDYGGYLTLSLSSLRQIRADFINLPFQAAECYLGGIRPAGECVEWSEEAKQFVEKLTFAKMLQAQVHGYADDGVPCVHLYSIEGSQVTYINQELVDHGYAQWLFADPVTEQSQV